MTARRRLSHFLLKAQQLRSLEIQQVGINGRFCFVWPKRRDSVQVANPLLLAVAERSFVPIFLLSSFPLSLSHMLAYICHTFAAGAPAHGIIVQCACCSLPPLFIASFFPSSLTICCPSSEACPLVEKKILKKIIYFLLNRNWHGIIFY